MPQDSLTRIADLARDQWGLITRRQAVATGLAPSTIARTAAGGGALERIGHAVYHLRGAPLPDHLDLRAEWLRLAPETPAWERTPAQGVVSHRSAAAIYGLGILPADRHEFTLPGRRQSERPAVRLHRGRLRRDEWAAIGGMLVTRPSRIAMDLLIDSEDPAAVASIVAGALRSGLDEPAAFARALAPRAAAFGLRGGDGVALLGWLLDLAQEPRTAEWVQRAHRTLPLPAHETP